MSNLDYTKIERPVEPAFENEDPEGWCEVLAWEEARADKLEKENKELREFLGILQLDVSNEIKLEQLLERHRE